MANIAPAYQHEANLARLNQLVGNIIDPHHKASCRTYGQDYDDDLVDDPDYLSSEDDVGSAAGKEGKSFHAAVTKTRSAERGRKSVKSPHSTTRVPLSSPSPKPGSTNTPHPSSPRPDRHVSSQLPTRENSGLSPSKSVAERSSQVLISPKSAFLGRASQPPMPQSTGRILEDGTLEPMASPMSHMSGRTLSPNSPYNRVRQVLSPANSVRSPAPPYDEVVTKPQRLYRDISAQGWEPPARTRPKRQSWMSDSKRHSWSASSIMSVDTHFSGFAPHPAVRPLECRAVLGEAAGPDADDSSEYPPPWALTFIITGICLSVFIISLDRNIITTAIPEITAQFHSYEDIGWYGSAYLLTASAFQPLYGRVYMTFESKTTYLAALVVFMIGSLIAAVTTNSPVLILGRAVQGLGSAGILTGSFVVGTHSVRLQKRPILFAGVGILYGVGALCGPLLGGAFTDTIGWRWCFWINLPVGVVAFCTVFFCFKKRTAEGGRSSWTKRFLQLDLIGNVILLGAATMLFLALQFSESKYAWDSSRVIGLLCGFGVTTILFVMWMVHKGDDALIPPRIACQRTVAASCGAAFFIYGVTLIHAYYLPIWFQAIKGATAVESGVDMIPYMLANALFCLLAGIFVSKNGLFAPPAVLGTAIGTIGCGLLATLKPGVGIGTWIGYEVLASAGIGIAIQQGFSAVQTALPLKEVPIGTAAVVASQSCGGAIFVSIGNTLLQNHLLNPTTAAKAGLPADVNVRAIIEDGATMFRHSVPPEYLPALVKLYNQSLQAVFIAAVPLCGVAFLCSLCMEFRSVKGKQEETGEKLIKKSQNTDQEKSPAAGNNSHNRTNSAGTETNSRAKKSLSGISGKWRRKRESESTVVEDTIPEHEHENDYDNEPSHDVFGKRIEERMNV